MRREKAPSLNYIRKYGESVWTEASSGKEIGSGRWKLG